jgi:hypothetical protein
MDRSLDDRGGGARLVRREVSALALAVVGATACSKEGPRPPEARAEPATVAESPCSTAGGMTTLPGAARVVAIGDVHGDLERTRQALQLAGAIDDGDRWIGGTLIVVQTGDVLDRGDGEQAIIDLFERLEGEAAAAGGGLIWLLGNHELMNPAGDFRYVTEGGFADFTQASGEPDPAVPPHAQGRWQVFRPGGRYARILSGQHAVVKVGDVVYSHAGVLPRWAEAVASADRQARCWLSGAADADTAAPDLLTSDDSPVWTRAFGGEVDCGLVEQALAAVGASRMVVGHTVQQAGISSACSGRLWRIDVGLARAYGGPLQVLELGAAVDPKILSAPR